MERESHAFRTRFRFPFSFLPPLPCAPRCAPNPREAAYVGAFKRVRVWCLTSVRRCADALREIEAQVTVLFQLGPNIEAPLFNILHRFWRRVVAFGIRWQFAAFVAQCKLNLAAGEVREKGAVGMGSEDPPLGRYEYFNNAIVWARAANCQKSLELFRWPWDGEWKIQKDLRIRHWAIHSAGKRFLGQSLVGSRIMASPAESTVAGRAGCHKSWHFMTKMSYSIYPAYI